MAKTLIETIRIKVRRLYIKCTAIFRSCKIKNNNFTIISNNCWGGFIYQSYGIKYNTPTIGAFFMADDYIEFLSDVKKWIYRPIQFIEYRESKYYDNFKDWDKFGKYPIGVFSGGNIEIHFLHYNSEEEVIKSWNRRLKRINWDKVLYKFNDQNLCDEKHIKIFSEFPYKNKICFTSKKYSYPSVVYIDSSKKYSEVKASYEPFGNSKYININKLINNL